VGTTVRVATSAMGSVWRGRRLGTAETTDGGWISPPEMCTMVPPHRTPEFQMINLDLPLDRHSLLARQRPALFMLFPVLVSAVAIFPSLRSWWAALVAIAGTCGVSIALSQFAQGLGKRLEPALIEFWDGLPSVAMLRHRDGRLDAVTKERYKGFLARYGPKLSFPTATEEVSDALAADAVYMSATRWLLSQTRDTKTFALLFQQNINYGYRRNMLGLRPWGVAGSAAALIVTFGVAAIQAARNQNIDTTLVAAFVVAAAAFAYWMVAVRPNWVKTAADAYAHELLAACDRLAASVTGRGRANAPR
jgi:hypothetical protein